MKKRTILIATLVAVAALAAVPFVYAGPGIHRGPHGRSIGGHGFGAGMLFEHMRHIKEELDLSDAQVAQIKAIFAEVHEQNEAYRENLHGGLHEAMLTLLDNPNNVAAAQARLEQQAAAEKAFKTNLLNAVAKAVNVLTPEQRSELAKIVEERAERRAERRSDRR